MKKVNINTFTYMHIYHMLHNICTHNYIYSCLISFIERNTEHNQEIFSSHH